MTVYAFDMNGKLLTAGTYANDVFTPMTLESAAAGFSAEMRYGSIAVLPPTGHI